MKGQILDVYPEGNDTFRACVISFTDNFVKVIDLDTGEIHCCRHFECEKPIIENVFELPPQE